MLRIDDYILRLPDKEREIYIILREFIHECVPQVTEKISYGIPFFYLKKPFCYMHRHKGGVDLSFMAGHAMSNPHGALDMRDRSRVGSLHYDDVLEVDLEILKDTLLEAASFDLGWKKL
jgi:hypothetical protein